MSYEYKASKKERRAAQLLREMGWRVSEPACPECGGLGTIGRSSWTPVGQITTGTLWNDPCPNGCVVPSWYFASSTTSTGDVWTAHS